MQAGYDSAEAERLMEIAKSKRFPPAPEAMLRQAKALMNALVALHDRHGFSIKHVDGLHVSILLPNSDAGANQLDEDVSVSYTDKTKKFVMRQLGSPSGQEVPLEWDNLALMWVGPSETKPDGTIRREPALATIIRSILPSEDIEKLRAMGTW